MVSATKADRADASKGKQPAKEATSSTMDLPASGPRRSARNTPGSTPAGSGSGQNRRGGTGDSSHPSRPPNLRQQPRAASRLVEEGENLDRSRPKASRIQGQGRSQSSGPVSNHRTQERGRHLGQQTRSN